MLRPGLRWDWNAGQAQQIFQVGKRLPNSVFVHDVRRKRHTACTLQHCRLAGPCRVYPHPGLFGQIGFQKLKESQKSRLVGFLIIPLPKFPVFGNHNPVISTDRVAHFILTACRRSGNAERRENDNRRGNREADRFHCGWWKRPEYRDR